MGCERQSEFRRLYGSLRAATTHVGMSPVCRALGLGVREIRVAAGTGADVMASGAGAAGPTPDVRHQTPGYPDLLPYDTGYPKLSRLIPKQGLSRDIPG